MSKVKTAAPAAGTTNVVTPVAKATIKTANVAPKQATKTIATVDVPTPAVVNTTPTREKVSRDINFKIRVYALHQKGTPSKKAFEQVCRETKTPLSDAMISYPGSYMFDYKRSIEKKCTSKDETTLAAMAREGLKWDSATMSIKLAHSVVNLAIPSAQVLVGPKTVVKPLPVKKAVTPAPAKAVTPAPAAVIKPVTTGTATLNSAKDKAAAEIEALTKA